MEVVRKKPCNAKNESKKYGFSSFLGINEPGFAQYRGFLCNISYVYSAILLNLFIDSSYIIK